MFYFVFNCSTLKNKPNILACPLDWGIGHATRCVPIIREMLEQNANVILAASGRSLYFLEKEFPKLQKIDFPGYQFSYPENGSMALKMALQSPQILAGIKKENSTLKEIIKDYNINAVFSDNRYGLYSEKVPCVFMTHQIFIQTPGYLSLINPVLERINKKYINKFSQCWIPDFEDGQSLSGELSYQKPLPDNYHFIGPLSRFSTNKLNFEKEYKYKILVMLSGPEPQRTVLENLLIDQLSNLQVISAVVLGKTELKEQNLIEDHIDVFSHLESDKLKQLILESEIVVSRPGYSTVMDLVALNKEAIFIPTPGQTEQEYLAKYYYEKGYFYSMKQNNLNLSQAFDESKNYKVPKFNYDNTLLQKRISNLLKQL